MNEKIKKLDENEEIYYEFVDNRNSLKLLSKLSVFFEENLKMNPETLASIHVNIVFC